jgi:hypothetical protein
VTDPIYAPGASALPTIDDLADYMTITAGQRGPVVDGLLTDAIGRATDYEMGRLSFDLMRADGASPPTTVPSPVAGAVLMRAAALYRRRNSVNGFDGYEDLGTVPVRASDPDIERMVDRWRAWAWA